MNAPILSLGPLWALLAAGPPNIVSLTPASAVGSTLSVTIEGTGFDARASAAEVIGPDGRVVARATMIERTEARLVARLPDGKRVTIPRAGHTVQGDNPKDLVAELRRFLGKAN